MFFNTACGIYYFDMDPRKKQGIFLILIGMAIPLIALPFVTGLSAKNGLRDMFFNAGIEIRKEAKETAASLPAAESTQSGGKPKRTYSSLIPSRIPYRYFFAPMVLLIYIGIVKIDRSRKTKPDR